MSEGKTHTAVVKGMNRSVMKRAIGVSVVMILGVASMKVLEASLHIVANKPAMPLKKPLAELKTEFGEKNRYVALTADTRISADEVATLGTTKYLLRTYTDVTKKPGEVGSELQLNLNYYEKETSAFHVPEICWAGNGLVESPGSRYFFKVGQVRHLDGTVSELDMRMVSFEAASDEQQSNPQIAADPENHLKNVAYVFEVNGKYTASPDAASSMFWRATSTYAYGTKIEVSVGQLCSQQEAQAAITEYIRAALPEIEECLPDASLNESGAKAAVKTVTEQPTTR